MRTPPHTLSLGLMALFACKGGEVTVEDARDSAASDDSGVTSDDSSGEDTAPTDDSDDAPIEDSDDSDDPPVDDTGDPPIDDTGDPPDTVADPPALPGYSGGTCPALTHGATRDSSVNTGFMSSGVARDFRLMVPEDYDASRAYPVVFAWHWLNASSGSFVRDGELESAIDQMDFIVVLPDGKEEYIFDWPFAETWGAEEELVFFDDLLTCVGEQYSVDLDQVHGIGVSAGALWLTYLSTTSRSQHLASVSSLSGGLGNVFNLWQMQWATPPRAFPAVVLDGGPTDWLGVDFYQASLDYRDALRGDGHFVVYCEHDQGHGMPPIEPPVADQTVFYSLWQFMLDHPYSVGEGASPYEGGLPDFYEEWCSVAE